MEKYLKIGDYFGGDVTVSSGTRERIVSAKGEVIATTPSPLVAKLAAHAINSHDELVAEVERLTKSAELAIMTLEEVDRVLTERVKNGAYDLDDISGEVTYALDKISARE